MRTPSASANDVGALAAFEVDDLVELRDSATTTKGRVVEVSRDGNFVTVKWEVRLAMKGMTTTHPPSKLRKLPR